MTYSTIRDAALEEPRVSHKLGKYGVESEVSRTWRLSSVAACLAASRDMGMIRDVAADYG